MSANAKPIDELLHKATTGDVAALDALLERYRDFIRLVVRCRSRGQLQARLDHSDLVQETLMQAILQLPPYLDRLHREQQDSEQNYLPIVNNLRVARGENRIPGAGGEVVEPSGPDLGPLTDAPDSAVIEAYVAGKGEENLPKIRPRYQQVLGAILKKKDVRENLGTLGKLFTMVARLCGDSPMGNLAQIGLAVIEGIAVGGIKLDNESAGLLRKFDTELKRLATDGKDGLSVPVNALGAGLIALVNGASKESKRITAIREQYAGSPQDTELEEIAVGIDTETMSAVAKILIEELRAVTDKLDLYVRSPSRNTDDLIALLPNLEQMSSTMMVLGNADHQASMAGQIAFIKEVEKSGEADDEQLLQMAEALIEIETTLRALISGGDEGSESDSFANLDEAQATLVRECRTVLADCKDAVIEFISSDYDHGKIQELPDSLRSLKGGLIIVNQPQAGDILQAAASYVRALLVNKKKPSLEQLDDLADAITSIDYFLERLLENDQWRPVALIAQLIIFFLYRHQILCQREFF